MALHDFKSFIVSGIISPLQFLFVVSDIQLLRIINKFCRCFLLLLLPSMCLMNIKFSKPCFLIMHPQNFKCSILNIRSNFFVVPIIKTSSHNLSILKNLAGKEFQEHRYYKKTKQNGLDIYENRYACSPRIKLEKKSFNIKRQLRKVVECKSEIL